MRNIWLIRKELRNSYPIGLRIKVTGPFDILNEANFNQYIGEYGTIVAHMFQDYAYSSNFWIGVLLDVNHGLLGNNTNWFAPSEIAFHYEDYIC